MSHPFVAAQKVEEKEEVVAKPTNWVNIIATKLPLIGPKMPVLLQSEGSNDTEQGGGSNDTEQGGRSNDAAQKGSDGSDAGSALGALGGMLALAVVLGILALAIPITLTIFATKRNQPGTELYTLMCGFLVLMWCSQLLTPVGASVAGIGGFIGLVGTIVMVAKGGGCGGGGCKPGQSGEELIRSIVGSVAGSVSSGSSLTSF